MSKMQNFSKSKQIEFLCFVLGGGIIAGLILAVVMLYYYNPSGTYSTRMMLLEPDLAYSLSYVEPEEKSRSGSRYVFEGAYFSFFDPELNEMRSVPVPKEKYAEFRKLVFSERSIEKPDGNIEKLFNQPHSAVFSLKVRKIEYSKEVESIFTRIEFAYDNGGFYRIQLRQSTPGHEWAYFYHTDIYRQAMAIFTP